MKTHIMIGSVILCLASIAMAEEPHQVAWTMQIGSEFDDNSEAIAVDASGNTYIAGYTRGSIAGNNIGLNDVWVAKFDSLGDELWTRQIGTSGDDYGYSLALDPTGNAYICGSTEGSLGGESAGGQDAFLVKLDSLGNTLWSRQVGTGDTDKGEAVAVDSMGNAYLSGRTWGDFAGGNLGGSDLFLAKFDAAGNQLWSQQLGTSGYEDEVALAVDLSDEVYMSGYTTGSLAGPNAGGSDTFVIRFDSSGSEIWSQQIGVEGNDQAESIAVDGTGNVYITGYTENDLGGVSAGGHDAFLAKFDAVGSELWITQVGTDGSDYGKAVSVDALGNAYLAGSTYGDLGGPNAGYYDVFLSTFDPLGRELWRTQIGTMDYDICNAAALDSFGAVYVTGYTKANLGGLNIGGDDAFLVKYEPVPEPMTMSLLALGWIALLRKGRTL